MEDTQLILERHENKIRAVEESLSELKNVQTEIRSMNETLVILATELRHTNEHLSKQEERISDMEWRPVTRMQQIITAIISALAGGIVSIIIASVFK